MLKTVWSEKYRPTRLENIGGQDSVIVELTAIAAGEGSPQHYLFHSAEAGTGKTTVARAFANELGWPIHEFNASTKRMRGIEFVEEEIIPLSNGGGKLVFLLDEADQLTSAAQSALKGVIENTDGIFILTCNDISKVSSWIKSRVAVRHFSPIDYDWMSHIIRHIATLESLALEENWTRRIIKSNKGDLRSAINTLQALSCVPEDMREAFTLELNDDSMNHKLFLQLCFRDRDVESAVALLLGRDVRKTVRSIFEYAINSEASAESKMKVTEAAIISERDCINGVLDEIVKWSFCSMLCAGFIGRWGTGETTTTER
tara:strand:- start:1235 stop:2182 length:948 start_codon:yes stop_codon:yes gene_type:complete